MLRLFKKAIACASLICGGFLMMSASAHAASPTDLGKLRADYSRCSKEPDDEFMVECFQGRLKGSEDLSHLSQWCSDFDSSKNRLGCFTNGALFLLGEKVQNDRTAPRGLTDSDFQRDMYSMKFLKTACHAVGDENQRRICLAKNLKTIRLVSPFVSDARNVSVHVCLNGFKGDRVAKDRGNCLEFVMSKMANMTEDQYKDPYKSDLIILFREGCMSSKSPLPRKACFEENVSLMDKYFKRAWASEQREACARQGKDETKVAISVANCYSEDLKDRINHYEDLAKAEAEALKAVVPATPQDDPVLVPVAEEPKPAEPAPAVPVQEEPARANKSQGWDVTDVHAPGAQ